MIRFRMLGTVDLRDSDGRELRSVLRRPKLLALLGYLAAARPFGFHRRDSLVALLWPDLDNAHARNALRQALHALRDALGPEVVVARGEEELELSEQSFWCDPRAFAAALDAGRAEEALELCRGGLLTGLHLSEVPEFERWLDEEREHIRRRACETAHTLTDRAQATGNATASVGWARRLAELSPFDETAIRRLMQLLDRAGDRAGAVRAYEDFERRLGRDLEVEPSSQTRALVDGIRARRHTERPVPAGDATRTNAEVLETERSPVAVPGVVRARPDPPPAVGSRPVQGLAQAPGDRRKVLLVLALLGCLVIGAWLTGAAGVLWARYRGVPLLQVRVAAGHWEDAHQLAARLEAVIPHDSSVAALRAAFADTVSIEGTPPGARVYRRSYNGATAKWAFLGVAPRRVVVPRLPVVSQFKFEAPGFSSGLDIGAAAAVTPVAQRTVLRFALSREGVAPPGMVLVVGGEGDTGIPQLDARDRAVLPDFFIGRLEVTNREYQVFVDSGGYRRRDLWPREFIADGRRLSWRDALARFVDQTGQPGPSTWEAGHYSPEGADHPVAGVSWYEAMAYARFRGARLPNVFQWTRAARFDAAGTIVTASNIDRVRGGTAPVGSFAGMSGSGTMDMAGNVREWCVNESHNARGHYILGGGWNDPAYTFYESAIQPAFDRSATNGIRLVRPLPGQADATADRAIEPFFRDYHAERPASDEAFRFYRRLFAYDPLPLHAVLQQRDSSAAWIQEKVSFDAAYNGERVTAYVFLPRRGHPPYQTVVFFPGSSTLWMRSSDSLVHVRMFDFLVEAGRAVVYPVLKGTYERDDGTRFSDPNESNRYKEHVVRWQQDISRTLDYLGTRADVDTTRFGYLGFSWGGRFGGVVLSIEPRLRAAVLTVAGFSFLRPEPEADDINYTPRVHIPVLMINGRYDNTFPLETAARPMYDLLGTAPDRKRLVIAGGVHYVPRTILIREALAWFDRYLGPVE